MRLGFSVVLLAPQLSPKAVEHLCTAVGALAVLVDERHRTSMEGHLSGLKLIDIPAYDGPDTPTNDSPASERTPDVAFYFHTSGTSAGLPKPIPQAHSMVSALPSFLEQVDQPATFSTTPLYHGGLADCLRTWSSGAMIWFFPEGTAPITANTFMEAIHFAQKNSPIPIRYLSCVPYILQMLSETSEGMELLRSMDLVGFGGAALAQTMGDSLVHQGVNLLSRYGSAECGFLMSSHRDYSRDKEWRYLRSSEDMEEDLLSFEPQDGGLFELVVLPKWPVRSKTNRDDGSFATSDLFEAHPTIPRAWRYHSRADAQIALANGKKFDPAPIEGAILAASSGILQDVLIFGGGQQYPGILLFPHSAAGQSEKDIREAVWPHVEKINRDSPSQSRLTKSMLVVVSAKEGEPPLEKSSKGTILRRQAEEKYAHFIDSAYEEGVADEEDTVVLDGELPEKVLECFTRVLGREVHTDKDIYNQGVDSLACVQIRRLIERTCVPEAQRPLPLNIVYDQGTVNALVQYLRRKRGPDETEEDAGAPEPDLQAMRDLAQEHCGFGDLKWNLKVKSGTVVVLTGATGFLGAHVLHLLRQNPDVECIICLLRASSPSAAHERVDKALHKRKLPGLGAFNPETKKGTKVVTLPADLSSPNLGLSPDDLSWVTQDVSILIHGAWIVNFTLRLSSFDEQIAGTKHLIRIAASAGAQFLFVSSTASVTRHPSPIPERLSTDPSDASPMGYSQSKWVAEQVCVAAQNQPTSSPGRSRVSILRVGQLCSNNDGVWNTAESYPLMLSTAGITGCLPELPNVVLDWLPVEVAAQAVVEIALTRTDFSSSSLSTTMPVYHILNPHRSPTWSQMLTWLREADQDRPGVEIVSAPEWLSRLHEALKVHQSHPSQALLGVWERMVSKEALEEGDTPTFSVAEAQHISDVMKQVSPLDKQRLVKTWRWVQAVHLS